MSEPAAANEKLEPYQVVARRFRPKAFDEVVGQDLVIGSLRNALDSGRVPHAFLFAGSRGVGKTTSARILARALNCERGVSSAPCGACAQCRSTLEQRNPDVVEIDAASHNLVDDIRELRDRVGLASMGARYKVYILDEVHMLSKSAFNAFLKTLEEPPRNVVFVLATTELHKVPDTIRSRCQVLLFSRVGEPDIVERLRAICAEEGVAIGDDVLEEIAMTCRGGMRDAETALERVLPVAKQAAAGFDLAAYRLLMHRVGIDRTIEVAGELLAGAAGPALRFADEVVRSGVDEREALGELLDVLRQVLLLVVDGPESELVAARGALRARLVELAAQNDAARLDAMLQALLIGRERIRRLDDRRLVLEVTLLRAAQAGSLPTLGELARAVESGAAAAPRPAPGAAAVPAGAPAAGGSSLQAALAARMRQHKPMLESTVDECSIDGPDAGGVVRIALRNERKMHRDRLRSPEVQKLFREQIEAIVGRPVSLEFADQGARASPAGRAVPGPRAAGPSGGEAAARPPSARVRRVQERFDGQILEPDES